MFVLDKSRNVVIVNTIKCCDCFHLQTIFNQADLVKTRNVLVICDRGAMDPSAYMPRDEWLKMLSELGIQEFDLVNNRYNQV